jgi:hypothetical protein
MVFVKGDPNINRNGRPPGSISLIGILKEELEKLPEGENKEDWARTIIKKWLHNAGIKGEQASIDKIVDRIDGPVKQELEVSGGLDKTFSLSEEDKVLMLKLIDKKLEKM